MKAIAQVFQTGLAIRLCALALGLTCCANRASGEGWSLGGLNPFAAKQPAASNDHTGSAAKNAGLSGSTVITKPVDPPKVPPQPSMFSKIGAGTSNMMSKTKQMFTPAPKSPPPFKLGAKPAKPKQAEPASSWNPFASKQANPEPPRTASEFIGLPRPGLQ